MEQQPWWVKLQSRKFWTALVGIVAGLVALFGGPAFNQEAVVQVAVAVAGAAVAVLSALGYIQAEASVDRARRQTQDTAPRRAQNTDLPAQTGRHRHRRSPEPGGGR